MRKARQNGTGGGGDVKHVLHQLLERSRDPSRFLEVYYWATEPELTEFVRQFLALPASARLTLIAFMGMTKEIAASVRVTVGRNGEIILSSPLVSDAVKVGHLTSIAREPSESVH